MNHLQILDSHKTYQYVYLDACEELSNEYNRMYNTIKASGHALSSDTWPLDGGILLKNGSEVIAGAFFNISKSSSSLLIHIIFVEEQYRQQGIYTKMHSLLDRLCKELRRSTIYSYIHSENQIMQEHIMKKIGYETVMQLVKRRIK
jgi:RimJ/RimL family protein N-acetyltransferase